MPMAPPAPTLFSITKVWPSILLSRSAVSRAIVSVTPPTPYGTTTRTLRLGHCCADEGSADTASDTQAAAAASQNLVFIASSLTLFVDNVMGRGPRGRPEAA